MSPEAVCGACGYRVSSQAADRLASCPRCGTPLAPTPPKPADDPKRNLPPPGDLSDLEFSDSEAGFLIEDDVRKTRPRPKDEKETTDRQSKDRQAEKLAVQEHLASVSKTPPPRLVPGGAPWAKVESATKADVPQRRSSSPRLLSTFGPVLLVCALFLGWVVYDRSVRVPPLSKPSSADELVTDAVVYLRKGDRKAARDLLQQAIAKDPNSRVARELAALLQSWR
ncbi:MAG: hypothetical protein V1495_06665 [Pseudomonadota bacterium]